MKIKDIRQLIRSSVAKSASHSESGGYVLTNGNGLKLEVIPYGATVTSLKIPVADQLVDVVLGFEHLQDYIDAFSLPSAPYFGATVGRFAGRISNGRFRLDGRLIELNTNNGRHSLHGGNIGLSRHVWKVKSMRDSINPSITLKCISPDGDEHYPGELSIELTYTLSEENQFIIDYTATTTKDTIVNLTHHSYFNLDGHDSDVWNQKLQVSSDNILETDSENIPTGNFLKTESTRFDFSTPQNCPSSIDTTFVLNKTEPAATLISDKNNLKLSVFTDQPAVHIYVGGNCFNSIKGKDGADYHATSGICFETQNFPDAPNHTNFPSCVLRKGETYRQKTIYKFESTL
ncbi:MAG: galactose mutarotase [Flavobacterium sp.]|nr:MAG: galactose mutarotase [Flavobacterium sp.]